MSSSPMLPSAVAQYRAAMRDEGVPASTVGQYMGYVLRLASFLGPRRRVAGVTSDDLSVFLYGPTGILVGKKPATGVTCRAALRSFARYGQMRGWTKHPVEVPAPVFRVRHRSPDHGLPTRLSADQLSIMWATAEHPIMKAALAVSISTALRISDVQKIKLSDLDMPRGAISVWIKKTGSHDPMPITADLDSELRLYLGWYTAETGVTLDDPDAYLLPGWRPVKGGAWPAYDVDPYRPMSYSWSHPRLIEGFARCGAKVEHGEAWHVIRRSVARIYFDRLREQVSHDHALRQTSALLGHINSATTEKYLGLNPERAARDESMRGKRFVGPEIQSTVIVPLRRPGSV